MAQPRQHPLTHSPCANLVRTAYHTPPTSYYAAPGPMRHCAPDGCAPHPQYAHSEFGARLYDYDSWQARRPGDYAAHHHGYAPQQQQQPQPRQPQPPQHQQQPPLQQQMPQQQMPQQHCVYVRVDDEALYDSGQAYYRRR
jgi:hypothetical protein